MKAISHEHAVFLTFALTLSGCSVRTAAPSERAERSSDVRAPLVSPSFDPAEAIDRIRRGFHEESGGLVAEADAHRVRLTADGRAVIEARSRSTQDLRLSLQTVRLGRGKATSLAASAFRADGATTGVIDRGVARERVVNTAHAAEQQWEFAQKPQGSGDLVVEVATAGADFSRADAARGLRFGSSERGFWYSHATWIDARGVPTPVRADFRGGHIVLRVPDAVLEASAYPAVLDPTISVEFPADAPVMAAAPGAQTHPSVAFDGSDFLLVWSDERLSSPQIFAARVTPGGQVLDAGGIRVTPAGSPAAKSPAVSWDGKNFVVVWSQFDFGSGHDDIYAAFVSSQGAVVGAPFAVSKALLDQRYPRVASGGGTSLVTWSDHRSGHDEVYGARVSQSGTVLDPYGVAVATGTIPGTVMPQVASDGTTFRVVWAAGVEVHSASVSAAGAVNPMAQPLGVYSGNVLGTAIAFDGVSYLAAWAAPSAGGSDELWASRVSTAGVAVGTPISLGTWMGTELSLGAAFDGTDFVVSWLGTSSGTHAYAARVSSSGVLVDTTPIDLGEVGEATEQDLTVSSGGGITLFAQLSASQDDVIARRLDSTGAVVDPNGLLVSQAGSGESLASVASDGTHWLLAWVDQTAQEVRALRVDSNGSPLDPAPQTLSTSPGNAPISVAYANGEYLFALPDTSAGIEGRFMSSAGVLGAPFTIATAQADGAPLVTSNGTDFLVVWQGPNPLSGGTAMNAVFGARVTAAGTSLDPNGRVLFASRTEEVNKPVVSALPGSNYLVAWTSLWPGFGNLNALRLDSAANPIGAPISLAPEATNPVITSGPDEFLVLFVDINMATGSFDLYSRRVTSTGALPEQAPAHLSATLNPATWGFSAAFDGVDYVIAYDDKRNDQDLYALRLNPAAGLLDPDGIPVSTEPGADFGPAVVSNGTGTTLIAYSRFDGAAGSRRVEARFYSTPGENGTVCTATSHCKSGFCVDGVCCDSECGGNAAKDCLACSKAKGASADGTCTPLNAGTCDDSNGCTRSDRCSAGVCSGAPVTCLAMDECHEAGVCEPLTGTCSNPTRSDGESCAEGACAQGVCVAVDAGTPGPDAGTADAGDPGHDEPATPVGCGCTPTSGAPFGAAVLWMAALWMGARRRRS